MRSNSAIASTSRLPWPHIRRPVRSTSFPFIALDPSSLALVTCCRGLARPLPAPHGRTMFAAALFESEARNLLLAVAAMALDGLIGDPRWLWRGRLLHPVVLLGWLIARLERRLNRWELSDAARRWRGAASVLIVVGCAALVGGLI